jgi:hypothetical protein
MIIDGGRVELGPCPTIGGLEPLPSTEKIWERLTADLSGVEGLACGLDNVALERWIGLVDMRERAASRSEASDCVEAGRGCESRTPTARVVTDCDKALAAIEDRFEGLARVRGRSGRPLR